MYIARHYWQRQAQLGTRLFSSQLSTVYRGTAFENRCLDILRDKLFMSLSRVGGKDDGGIDLVGWWWLPDIASSQRSDSLPRKRVRVLAQCKAEKKKASPKYVREMEGVLYRYMQDKGVVESEDEQGSILSTTCVGLLLSESPFTKSTLLRAHSSPLPFLLLHIPPLDIHASGNTAGTIGSAVWNPALGGEKGLLRGQVELRWELPISRNESGRPGLWFRGSKLEGAMKPPSN